MLYHAKCLVVLEFSAEHYQLDEIKHFISFGGSPRASISLASACYLFEFHLKMNHAKYDRRNDLSLVGQYQINKRVNIGAVFVFATWNH